MTTKQREMLDPTLMKNKGKFLKKLTKKRKVNARSNLDEKQRKYSKEGDKKRKENARSNLDEEQRKIVI